MSRREIAENHRKLEERNRHHRRFGYDVGKGIAFVLAKCLPLRGRVLEIGTGQGRFAVALAARVQHLDSVDADPAVLGIAALNLAWHGLARRVRLFKGDAGRLPWATGTFDSVVSMNVIHHLRSPMRVAAEMLRVARPGGKVVVADFDRAGFRIMARLQSREGKVHPEGRYGLRDISRRFGAIVRSLRVYRGKNQEVLVIRK